MTKKGYVILFVLIAIVGGAIGGIIMYLNQQEAVQETAEPSPAVTLSEKSGFSAEEDTWVVSAELFDPAGWATLM